MSNEATTTLSTKLVRLALDQIKPGINPRIKFDAEELEAMAATMKADNGAVQLVTVYLDDDGRYGLIAGERRWRASTLAGLEYIEAVLKPKPEPHEARRFALVENMCREDLTPVEIARAVRDMLAEKDDCGIPRYNRTQLAAELGVSAPQITWYLHLLNCSPKVQEMVHNGTAEFRVAAIIGSLPMDMHEIAERDLLLGPKPMTKDEAGDYVATHYRRELKKGQFNKDDATLIPGKPACKDCPHWGGNRDDVKASSKGLFCFNPACFDAKQLAHVKATSVAVGEANGIPMLGEDMIPKVFSFDGVTVNGDSGYVAADQFPDAITLVDPKAKVPLWDAIAEPAGVPKVKIIDGEGRVRTLYDARLAMQAATAEGSAVRHLFKSGSSAKGTTSIIAKADPMEAVKATARANGIIASGQRWMEMVSNYTDPLFRCDVALLICDRLTESIDREWMTKVLGTKNFRETVYANGIAPLLSLALIARTMRLQGPTGIVEMAAELATSIGYDPKKEARDIEALVAAAAKGKPDKVAKPKSAKPEKELTAAEEIAKLYDQTTDAEFAELAANNDDDREDESKPEVISQDEVDEAKPGLPDRNEEGERIACKAYIATGSYNKAAEAAQVSVNTVKAWCRRREWKKLREAALAKAGK